MPRILINATPCAIGGGVQVSLGVIREALANASRRGWTLALAVSPAVAVALGDEPARAGVLMEVFPAGPGSAFGGRRTRARIKALCREFEADVVFTVFGPSYVRFPAPEFMGFADGFAITPMHGCYANHPINSRIPAWLKANAKRFFIGTARRFWVETETAKAGLCRRAGVAPECVEVVPNGVNAAFAAALRGGSPSSTRDILLLGAGYPHKNHALIPTVAHALEKRINGPWRFTVTLPENSTAWIALRDAMSASGLPNRLQNLGVLDLPGCAAAYEAASVVFHPSLLEIFSATYIEAMAARRPLLVSDRPFSREVCVDAAEYFDPLDPVAAADQLAALLTDPDRCAHLVAAGESRLRAFPDASAKNSRLCDLIDEFAASGGNPGNV